MSLKKIEEEIPHKFHANFIRILLQETTKNLTIFKIPGHVFCYFLDMF